MLNAVLSNVTTVLTCESIAVHGNSNSSEKAKRTINAVIGKVKIDPILNVRPRVIENQTAFGGS
jgi:hypothetical protein